MTRTEHADERREYAYRVEERLSILCGSAEPTPEQRKIAETEATAWVVEERKRTTGELSL